jgi:hypothetical protein
MGIAALALVMTLVQGFDGLIGALAHDPASTYGPFCFRPREPRCTGVVAAFTWKQQRLAKNFQTRAPIHDFQPHRSARADMGYPAV